MWRTSYRGRRGNRQQCQQGALRRRGGEKGGGGRILALTATIHGRVCLAISVVPPSIAPCCVTMSEHQCTLPDVISGGRLRVQLPSIPRRCTFGDLASYNSRSQHPTTRPAGAPPASDLSIGERLQVARQPPVVKTHPAARSELVATAGAQQRGRCDACHDCGRFARLPAAPLPPGRHCTAVQPAVSGRPSRRNASSCTVGG